MNQNSVLSMKELEESFDEEPEKHQSQVLTMALEDMNYEIPKTETLAPTQTSDISVTDESSATVRIPVDIVKKPRKSRAKKVAVTSNTALANSIKDTWLASDGVPPVVLATMEIIKVRKPRAKKVVEVDAKDAVEMADAIKEAVEATNEAMRNMVIALETSNTAIENAVQSIATFGEAIKHDLPNTNHERVMAGRAKLFGMSLFEYIENFCKR